MGLVRVISPTSLPATPSNTAATADEVMQCAQGYSGCIGVSPSGSQPGSRGVRGLPLWSAFRMAVTGRQKLKAYFASNTAMNASPAAIDASAKSRAQSSRFICLCAATCCTMGLKVRGPARNQNFAMSVCSAERVLLLSPPISRISLKSRVQVSELSAGGGAGRNCAALDITHVVKPLTVDESGNAVGT